MKDIRFNSETHEYFLVEDAGNEVRLPSVTEIVTAVTGKDLSRIPKKVLEEARERGKMIHADVENRTFQTLEGQWIKKQLPELFFSERMGFGQVGGVSYAGTLDIIADKEIDDIKTTYAKDILGWTIQLNLYRAMHDDIEKLSVLWTPKSEEYERIPIQVLTDSQMDEIADAYQSHRILPKDWLSERPAAPSLDLIVYNQTPGQLATNARIILATVKKQLEQYCPENYSEDNIADAKKDKATLNNAIKALNDKRIDLEREWNRPFEEFKGIVAETISEMKAASNAIDSIVKDVEQREKDAKRKQIEDFFAAQACSLFSLNQIWNLSWLNKGAKLKDIEAEIIARIEKVQKDLATLDGIGEPEAKEHYLDTLNMESALAEVARIRAARERLAQVQRPAPAPIPEPQTHSISGSTATLANDEEVLERRMFVRCTRAKIRELSRFMNENGIYFEKIEEAANV